MELSAELSGPRVHVQAVAAVLVTAKELQVTAKSLAPTRSGTLRKSIRVTGSGLKVAVVAATDYSAFVEYGTSRMAPHSFMNPAADRAYPRLYAELSKVAAGVLDGLSAA